MSLSVELSMTYVSLIKSDYTNFRQALERAVDLIGKIHLEDKNSIAVKINLCDCRPPETGAITHPESLDAVLGYLRSNFPKIPIYVVESDATVTRPDLLIDWFGFRGVIEKWNAEWRNLTHEKTQRMKIKGRHFKSVKVPTLLRDSFIVNLSKLKTHSLTKISCSLKNQYGCIVYPLKIHFHGFLDDAIVDANTAMPSNLSIVDGVVAMGGPKVLHTASLLTPVYFLWGVILWLLTRHAADSWGSIRISLDMYGKPLQLDWAEFVATL